MSFVQQLRHRASLSIPSYIKSTRRLDAMYSLLKLVSTNQATVVTKTHTIPRTKLYSNSIKYPATIVNTHGFKCDCPSLYCYLIANEVENFLFHSNQLLTCRKTFMRKNLRNMSKRKIIPICSTSFIYYAVLSQLWTNNSMNYLCRMWKCFSRSPYTIGTKYQGHETSSGQTR